MGTIGYLKQFCIMLLILCILFEPLYGKRGGGGGFSMGRGSSGARAGSRGTSGSRSSGGIFGGGSRNTNTGIGAGRSSGSGASDFGRNTGASGQSNWGKSSSHKYSKGSGIGSVVRSNQFKNAIVGAAAGYLIYQGGKHMIRSAMAPMMWNNRQYYWGPQYYQSRPGYQMCRMPLESTDEQFSNVYFQDQTRPREIVWSCGYNEVCCGTECCRVNGGSGWGYGGFGLGSLIILLLFCCCGFYLIRKYCINRENNRWGNKQTYSQGEAQYTTNEAPPQYPGQYPPPPQNYYYR